MLASPLLRLLPDAPQALAELLDGAAGALQAPIRSEIFGPQRFAEHGRSLGQTHGAGAASWRQAGFYPRLRSNIETLRRTQRYISAYAAAGHDISPAAEWLLDNTHLIEAQLKEVHDGLTRRYFRSLPVLLEEPLAGLPRIYGVAWAFVAHTDGAFDEELLVRFLAAYQETRELSLSEIWALPTTLRVVLVENLRRLAERVATHKAALELANLCCDRKQACSTSTLDALLALLNRRGASRPFLAQLGLRMQDQRGPRHAALQTWLLGLMPDLASAQAQLNADQTADNLSVSNAVGSLRIIGEADWPEIVAASSALMQLMLDSPLFEAEHIQTRDQALHAIERLARRSGRSELAVGRVLQSLMAQAPDPLGAPAASSYWLLGQGRATLLRSLGLHDSPFMLWRALRRHLSLPLYLGALLLGTLALTAWLLLNESLGLAQAPWWMGLAGAMLLLLPASEAVVALVNRLISESVQPRHLPRLALATGIPPEQRVMVVIPAMLSNPAAIDALARRLLLHYLANPEPQAQFALATDWSDADSAHTPADAALLKQALRAVHELNRLYGHARAQAAPRFILLQRERRFCATEQRWMGWERKRGKLEQLIEALATGKASAFTDLGEASRIAADTRYLLTLDSDTELPPGRLRDLVGVAAHPHNQPRLDASGRRVVSGYAILQPRVVTPLPAAGQLTRFHWLFAGQCGVDPYSAASSEVYQDLFGEGSFSGKGLLHVQTLQRVLAGRLPENAILSHDLLEGALVRCAAVTDLMLIEDAPFHADVAAARVHRWTRGDWQLLPLLLQPRQFPLNAINRWKLFDNLRRSLVAPAGLGLLLMALAGHGVSIRAALGLVLMAFFAGPLIGALAGFLPGRDELARRHFYKQALTDLLRVLLGGLWHLAQLMEQAWMAGDAILRTLYRMAVSRRHLLQWTTAAAAQAAAKTGLAELLRQHRRTPALALPLAALLWNVDAHPLSLLLCGLWAGSPLWTWWVSRPAGGAAAELPPAAQTYLHDVARDTWRYFERCVSAEDRHLPPDNLQVLPMDMLAHRSSPTNIGLYLLSVACARQFGWIGTQELLDRLQATLATLLGLERHRGHFLNWYDTLSGLPLLPRYVSSVDSGNLCGHLLAVAEACRALALDPLDAAPAQAALARGRARLLPLLARRNRLEPAERTELRQCLADLRTTQASAARDECVDISGCRAALLALASSLEQLALQADFSFLYHRKRHLLHLGFRVAEQQLDSGFYDLLASESRLSSLLAIANGSVPVRHWAALGRPFYAVGTRAGLRSWSGSMFEYLMPGLVLIEPPGSALREACDAALTEQVHYAERLGVPWGISESAYAGRDLSLAYQYAPQGVPRLALRRTPAAELVVAPYATALAAQIAPLAACSNFAALERLGARGRYGFIEALDFTPERQSFGEDFTPVATFMAHHQGMSIVALANVLLDGVAQRWGMANAHLEAVASLLHERAPREISNLYAPPSLAAQAHQRSAPSLRNEVPPGQAAVEPSHLLSNGRYRVALRANGAGWSRWGEQDLSRWRDDALRDAHGHFFFLRLAGSQALVSLTQHPAPDAGAEYHGVFHADRVCLSANWPGLHSELTVWVSPEDDIEFRQVELRNSGDQPIELELISCFEPTLALTRADEAHPAFSQMFLSAQGLPQQQALLFERRPRLAAEPGLQAAHFLAHSEPPVLALQVQLDRQRWQGRNRAVHQPQGSLVALTEGELVTGLDPVCVLAATLRIEPRGKALLTFATAAAEHGATLRAVIDKYRQPSHVERASLMSATLAGIRLRALRISPDSLAAVQTLSTALLLTLTRPPAPGSERTPPGPGWDRRLLWRFGLSGERPLVLVHISTLPGLGLLRALDQGLRLWSWGGVPCDLVVINEEAASYEMALQREIAALRQRHQADAAALPGTSSTAFHLLRVQDLSAAELDALQQLARVQLRADGRPLAQHVRAWLAQHELAREVRQGTDCSELPSQAQTAAIAAGAFSADGSEYSFEVGTHRRPPRPWINVLANPDFGCLLSEAGGGGSWARNSRMNQLTAWSNDPVSDPPSEWWLLQDLHSRETWSVTPSAWGAAGTRYHVVHGQGYTRITHRRGDLAVSASWCVDAQSSVKQLRLRIVNDSPHTRRLRLVGIAEWLMGASRADRASVHTALFSQRLAQDGRLTVLLATQQEQAGGLGQGCAFLALVEPGGRSGAALDSADWSCDRRECFDARGRLVLPEHFGQTQGGGLDPCAALATRLQLAPGEALERVFLLGYADSPEAARQLALRAAMVDAEARQEDVRERWDLLLGASTVSTPDPLFDALVNRWLLYQTLSCRLWAKAGFYQAGGATGYRDQLQDTLALSWAAPDLLRQQLLRCASRQYPEGDVQHWWHEPGGAGVRTHFSDDLLWLPHACSHYLSCSGDAAVLDEVLPFIEGSPIPEGAEDIYETPRIGEQGASLYEHAARAIDRSLRVGAHGLPLMGSGDWNDGMNRVGHGGRGESVWLGWFLARVVADFLPLAQARGDLARVQRWQQAAQGWAVALRGPAWDGRWYRRAFFDDGQPLGSNHNAEARIDLIAQAWAVLSRQASPERQRQAMDAVEQELVDHEAGLLRLLTPPLVHAEPSAGYIQAYPPGVRENGGQYSHGAIWALMAQAALGRQSPSSKQGAELAYRYFCMLSPAHRSRDPRQGPVYGLEPYAMAGDICSAPPYVGRGGWSWYTGAAAWMHRAALESLFGLRLQARSLSFQPCLPPAWQRAELSLRREGRLMRFVFVRTTPSLLAALLTEEQAQLLRPGQLLEWPELGLRSSFVMALAD
ncbi:MAG: carbohydrate-binding protein [Methylibium sp.]|nr:carbohydrate-binding protein [Methylibium sp.]